MNFPDLQLQPTAGQEESFWPSFTDILTVIVIVFLLAMVVVLMKNAELVRELTSTIEAERASAQLAQALGEDKAGLADRLLQTEERLAIMLAQLDTEKSQRRTLRRQLDTSQTNLRSVQASNTELTNERNTLSQQLSDTQADLQSSQTSGMQIRNELSQLHEEHNALSTRASADRTALASARDQLAVQSIDLSKSQAELQTAQSDLAESLGSFNDLKVKYDRLIRPARSAKGKFVVEVQYSKHDGKEDLKLRDDPNKTAFKKISRKNLDKALSRLKDEHSKNLYIKIVFPEDSGLSYNEAWGFTRSILYKYDYYYVNREKAQ